MKLRHLLIAPAVLLSACASRGLVSSNEVGSVEVAVTNVPTDVACIRLTLARPDTIVQRAFDVAVGASSVLSVGGLPVGPMTFRADAFGAACSAVGASEAPGWISNEQTVSITAGVPTPVTLTMMRNGKACVAVDFPVDDFSSDAGAPAAGGPVATITSGPTGTTTSSSATFVIAAPTSATLECSLDGAPFAPCTSPFTQSGLALGTHDFRVRAVAASCERGPVVSRSWTIAAGDAGSDAGPTACLIDGVLRVGQVTTYTPSTSPQCTGSATPWTTRRASVSESVFAGSARCGACAEVTGPGGTSVVLVEDVSDYLGGDDLDLTSDAYAEVGGTSGAPVSVAWRFVPCAPPANVVYDLQGSNPFFVAVQLTQHRNPVTGVQLQRSDGSWVTAVRASYNAFTYSGGGALPAPLRIRATDSFGATIEFTAPDFASGARDSGVQFPAACAP
jgi:hypothetical protein